MAKWMVVIPIAAAVGALCLKIQEWRNRCILLQQKLMELQDSLDILSQQRNAERTGRIRAQRDLRKALVNKDCNEVQSNSFPMTPIGYIRSCFSTRNGTPRQPLLVAHARACLTVSVPVEALEGLDQYSHCWLLYVFHENTDLHNLWKKPAHQDFKAKVRVPRLQGGKLGVFATRTPHRPCPIGLTVAKIEKIRGRELFLSGIDLVNGTPVLDVKPYLTYCDCVVGALTPSWAQADRAQDPLALTCVKFNDTFLEDMSLCWQKRAKVSLYSSSDEFIQLVEEVLSRDIRSLNQRQRPHNAVLSDVTLEESEVKLDQNNSCEYETEDCHKNIVFYHLILEGVKIKYTIHDNGVVLVLGAALTTIQL